MLFTVIIDSIFNIVTFLQSFYAKENHARWDFMIHLFGLEKLVAFRISKVYQLEKGLRTCWYHYYLQYFQRGNSIPRRRRNTIMGTCVFILIFVA